MDFVKEAKELNINLTQEQLEQFELYYSLLIETNQKMNLTAITEKEEVYRKHFLDSLELVRVIQNQKTFRLCDVGSGAGFPSIPLAIIYPEAEFTIIDALNKRIVFLKDVIQKLHLNHVVAIHARAEDYQKQYNADFDYVTARAVARLDILAELCLPLVRVGGKMLAMKGSSGAEELNAAQKAISILGGKTENVICFELPDLNDQRQIIILSKIKNTPKGYPRSFAKIKEKPL